MTDRPRLKRLLELLAAFIVGFVAPVPTAGASPPAAVPLTGVQPDAPPRITGKTEYAPHGLVRLRAEGVRPGSAALWRVTPRAEVSRATTRPEILEFAAPPGAYEVELLVMRQDGGVFSVEEVFQKVTIGGQADPKPEPKGKLDPVNALGRIQFGNAGCTATVIGPRRPDGRWDILTAAHCVPGVGSRGTMKLKDGRTLGLRVVVHQERPDLAWCVTEEAVEDLPFARLAAADPAPGVKVWHMGYGIDKPGNREDGEVSAGENGDGQIKFSLSVSSGDSGGGILRADTDEVVSAVCCTAGLARKTSMWGASTAQIRAARPGALKLDELKEPGCCK